MARPASRDADCDDDDEDYDEDYDEEVRTDSWRPWRRRYRVDQSLPDGLPAEIDPDTADELYCWLEPALDRAHELLALLGRRAAEDWPDDEAQTTPSRRLCGPRGDRGPWPVPTPSSEIAHSLWRPEIGCAPRR